MSDYTATQKTCWSKQTLGAVSDCTAPKAQIRANVKLSVSTQTIEKCLLLPGLWACIPLTRLSLTRQCCCACLQWWCKRVTWEGGFKWHSVVFADVSRFYLHANGCLHMSHRAGERDIFILFIYLFAYDTWLSIDNARVSQVAVFAVCRENIEQCCVFWEHCSTPSASLFQQDNTYLLNAHATQHGLQDFGQLPWPAKSVFHWVYMEQCLAPSFSSPAALAVMYQ